MPSVRGSSVTYTLGPGYPTPGVKHLMIATAAVFALQIVASFIAHPDPNALLGSTLEHWLIEKLGLIPRAVLGGMLWQPVTYIFLHGGLLHLIFNLLSLWMFGVDLERRWGRTAFLRYFFVCGIGAGLTVLLVSLLPFDSTRQMYRIPTIGASGGIFGLLMAYGMLFPHRTIFFFIFPIPVWLFLVITGAFVLAQAGNASGGVAHYAHLGGLIVGYLYLTIGSSGGPGAEIKYRYVKWRMNRLKKRFDVHEGGRKWDSKVH
jgi:membrane associated rhomboid family serine protease